jgi:branched-chain amino acid transport system permease protein
MKNMKNFILFAAVLAILPLLFLNQTFLISIFSQVLIFSIAALGLNVLIGYAGQISIGHAAFMALGAYLSAVLTKNFNFPFLITIFLAGGFSGLFGLILGFPALRLKGFYLAIATMAFGVAVEKIVAASDFLGGGSFWHHDFHRFGEILSHRRHYHYLIHLCSKSNEIQNR